MTKHCQSPSLHLVAKIETSPSLPVSLPASLVACPASPSFHAALEGLFVVCVHSHGYNRAENPANAWQCFLSMNCCMHTLYNVCKPFCPCTTVQYNRTQNMYYSTYTTKVDQVTIFQIEFSLGTHKVTDMGGILLTFHTLWPTSCMKKAQYSPILKPSELDTQAKI